ncbi:MAG: sulfatase [Opitutales bacterium]
MPRPPNIVFVIADDVTPAYHGCYGGRTPTPHLDRLAQEGIRFDRACGVAPLCNPSRYSIFTGCFPGRAPSVPPTCPPDAPYAIAQNADLFADTPSLPKLLRANGYFTGHVGKWHSNFEHAGPNEWPADVLGAEADLDEPKVDAVLRERQATHQRVVRECAGFEWVQAVHWGNLMGNRPKALQSHNPSWLTDTALRFLDAAKSDGRPFYLHLAHTVPHGPDPHLSLGLDHRYTFAGRLERPPGSHPPDETVLARLRSAGIETDGPIGGINAGIVQIDDQIGVLLERLEALGELDNTLFIYTADHGVHSKGTCYRGGWHLPLLMRWPDRVQGGRTVAEAVSHVDFLPTLCDAAGITLPEPFTCDGVSYLSTLTKHAPVPRAVTYQEMGVGRAVLKGKWHYIAIRHADAVLSEIESGAREEVPDLHPYFPQPFCEYNFRNKPHYFEPDQLFDIEADPHERTNRIDDPDCATILADLRRELFALTDTLPGPFPAEPPPVMRSKRYRDLVEARRARNQAMTFYPDGHDQEQIFNLNLPDPAVAD